MRIAIVGANSYIARNFTKYVKSIPDIEVDLFDIQSESLDGYDRYNSINVLDPAALESVDFDVDLIYMFTGKTGSLDGFNNPEDYIRINELSLLNLINAYRTKGSSAKIVFPSTRLVYKGKHGLLGEDSEKEAKTIYAANKLSCERYLKMYSNVYGVRYCIVRICVPYGTMISNVYSYGTTEFMLNKAKKGESITLYGDGSVRRTLTYIEDLCDILLSVGKENDCINDVYNIGGEDYSLKEMAELIADRYNVAVQYIPWPREAERIESGDTVFDSRKLEGIMGKYDYSRFSDWVYKANET